jgi:predicted O-methyltransferase YrrM
MTHVPLLTRAVLRSTGPILECGAGYFSTPLLFELSLAMGRPLITIEDAPEYAALARSYEHPLHRVIEGNYDTIRRQLMEETGSFGVIFLDHSDAARKDYLAALGDRAQYVVIHDTDGGSQFPGHPYRYDDRRSTPWTTLLSTYPIWWTEGLTTV